METYFVQILNISMGTALGYVSRFWRYLRSIGKNKSKARFVPIQERIFSSDLVWSLQFYKAVQASKWNRNRSESPPVNWKGVLNMKDPFAWAIYPILLGDLRPATIIELGSFTGGSAVWLADMMTIQGVDGFVYSFDINIDRIEIEHPKVEFRQADSMQLDTFDSTWLDSLPHPWLVIEDAHVNVYNIMNFFAKKMRVGDYLVGEDTLYYKKHRFVKKFAIDQQGAFLVDTRYTDMFGYNVTWNFNSVLKKVR